MSKLNSGKSIEVTDSGFHKLLNEAISNNESFESALDKFDSELGGEARALLRAMIANRGNH
jgi:hypothetical protein